jgi:hypothetical protein
MAHIQPLDGTQGDRSTAALDVGIGPASPGVFQQTNSITNATFLERLVQLLKEMKRQHHTARF